MGAKIQIFLFMNEFIGYIFSTYLTLGSKPFSDDSSLNMNIKDVSCYMTYILSAAGIFVL